VSDDGSARSELERVAALLSDAPVQIRQLDFTPQVACELCGESSDPVMVRATWRVRGQDTSRGGAVLDVRVCSDHADAIESLHRDPGGVTRMLKPAIPSKGSATAWEVVKGLFNL
jgi:hypothetical protein